MGRGRPGALLRRLPSRCRVLLDVAQLPTCHPRLSQVTVAMKVVQGLHLGVTTRELDQLAAEICALIRSCSLGPEFAGSPFRAVVFAGAYSSTFHPDWSVLAARIAVSNLHKETEPSFSKNCETLFNYRHPKVRAVCALARSPAPRVSPPLSFSLRAPDRPPRRSHRRGRVQDHPGERRALRRRDQLQA